MSLRTDAYYRGVADEALRAAGLFEPPVAMDTVATRMGARIILVAMPAFFQAATICSDGAPAFVLNAALAETRRRQCVAHLLGHALAELDDPGSGYPRDSLPEHHVAEVIAGELILPSRLVVEQAAKWFNDHRYLARLFGVSEGEMLAKMRDLGLMRSKGLGWDY